MKKQEKKFEEKFIVINKKFLDMLRDKAPKGEHGDSPPQVLCNLGTALSWLEESVLNNLGVDLSTKRYYVCNQDEPYAKDVIEIILGKSSRREVEEFDIEEMENIVQPIIQEWVDKKAIAYTGNCAHFVAKALADNKKRWVK